MLLVLEDDYTKLMSTLYMVATPIGNLEDITLRAIRTLKEVDMIACEDTRHTLQLLNHLEIKKPLIACYSYEEAKGSAKILSLLEEGKNIAYCSDAGTPGISDPGVLAASIAKEKGHDVVPIPGACAFVALTSAAGVFHKAVTFDGFPSIKPGKRRKRLEELMSREEIFILYESPHRIVKLLEDIADIDSERVVCLGRELTKMHEEILKGSASFVLNELKTRDSIKGEISLLVSSDKKK